jgi:hypothetical protein
MAKATLAINGYGGRRQPARDPSSRTG